MPCTSRAYGLTIASDITLHGPRACAVDTPDISIALGAVPERLTLIETETVHWQANARELLLHVPRVGRFHVSDGCSIVYEPMRRALPEAVSPFLMGSCLGAILHQRGLPVLHAAAVAAGNRCFAICGKSGTGKSTTASWLVRHGAKMMSDDLAVFSATDPPLVEPGFPQTKLTEEALDRLGLDPAGFRCLDDERGKFIVPHHDACLGARRRLGGLFVLERANIDAPTITQLTGATAMRALVKHTYRRHYVVRSRSADYFARWGEVARRTPIWQVTRPRGVDSTDFVVSAISREINLLRSAAPEFCV